MSATFVILVLIAIAGLAVFISMRPDEFRVTRSIRMQASPQVPFDLVNDFRKWAFWSPWATLDPAAKNQFQGPPVGTGSMFSWEGNRHVGAGKMTIEESYPSHTIKIKLEFFKPMKGVSIAEYTFKQEGEQTLVTWSMSGKNTFLAKAMSLVMNCEKMMGGMFEKGLANMKNVAEKGAVS